MQHEHHRVPVTALAFFHGHILLTGEGNRLRAYSPESETLIDSKIFENQAIHGIVLDGSQESTALIYGGCLIRTLIIRLLDNGKLDIHLGPGHDLGDWILAVSFIPVTDNSSGRSASLVTAHNALNVARIDENATEEGFPASANVECLVSRSNCILYSAHASWLSASHCLIASGTAFGDIIVWSAFLTSQDGKPHTRTQTHYTFSAHEGSIFGVQISPQLTLPGSVESTCVLASCSDDRNIKLWDISDLTVESPTLAEMQRQTGFGTSEQSLDVAPPCLAKVMGHMSRIWQVRFIISDREELQEIQSFGEDASVITWALHPAGSGQNLPLALNKAFTSVGHSGKNIWSVTQAGSEIVATGGADGAIAFHSNHHSNDELIRFSNTHTNGSMRNDSFKTYCFIGTDILLSTTEEGRIVRIDLTDESTDDRATIVAEPIDSLRGFSIITSAFDIAFVAGANGTVLRYQQTCGTVDEVCAGSGKPAGLFACNYSGQNVALLVTSVGASIARLVLLQIEQDTAEPQPAVELLLGLPSGFVVTSFSMIAQRSGSHAILGSRSGSIALYNGLQITSNGPASPSQVLGEVHGKEAVTRLYAYIEDGQASKASLLSTGRDGTLAIHRMSFSNDEIDLELIHQLSLLFGPNIEGMSIATNGKLLVWGFKSKHFVVYNITEQRELMSVECGGAHRNWTFQPHDTGGTFVWTKASKVYRRTQHKPPCELINSGGHGREIKSVAISPNNPPIIATGAEDTDIRLHRFEDRSFRCLQTLRKHNTGIQCLKWSADGRFLFSSGGFEEFFVWKVNHAVPLVEVGVVCESKHPRSGTSDLRIMGFEVNEVTEEPGQHHFSIVKVYSDSSTKLWHYKSTSWSLQASGDYLTACLTHPIRLNTSTPAFLTTATDGHLTTWSIDYTDNALSWTTRHKIHQSAIHAVATRQLPDASTLLASGGDDNAIGLTRIWTAEDGRCVAKTAVISRAHAAAVTGVVLIPVDERSMCWMVSTSIDQRMKLWRVRLDADRGGIEGLDVELLQDVFTAVADVASLDVCELEGGARGVVVSGVGMDVWRLPPFQHVDLQSQER